jgi:hypothetical protein
MIEWPHISKIVNVPITKGKECKFRLIDPCLKISTLESMGIKETVETPVI